MTSINPTTNASAEATEGAVQMECTPIAAVMSIESYETVAL